MLESVQFWLTMYVQQYSVLIKCMKLKVSDKPTQNFCESRIVILK